VLSNWLLIDCHVQTVERVLVLSELQDKVAAQQPKMVARVESQASRPEPKLKLAMSVKQRYIWRLPELVVLMMLAVIVFYYYSYHQHWF